MTSCKPVTITQKLYRNGRYASGECLLKVCPGPNPVADMRIFKFRRESRVIPSDIGASHARNVGLVVHLHVLFVPVESFYAADSRSSYSVHRPEQVTFFDGLHNPLTVWT